MDITKPVYLDYSATTPVDPSVAATVRRHLEGTFGNASSIHSYGRTAKVVLEESRETVAQEFGAEPSEIFFTSGGTEGDNHALIGTALHQRRERGRDRILISAVEHHAVLDCAAFLSSAGFVTDIVPVDARGIVDPADVESRISDRTALISVMHANNETGALQPVSEIASIAHRSGIRFHTDAVQTAGRIPVKMSELSADLLTISGHKIYGPKGVGAIVIRKGTGVDPLMYGGAQERKNRPGTENIPLIAGLAEAIRLIPSYRGELYRSAVQFRSELIGILQETGPGIIVNSPVDHSLPHILSVSLDLHRYAAEPETLLMNMDLRGIAVSSGSACTSGSLQPSHVLMAMGRDARTASATVRFSFGKFTTIDEVRTAGGALRSVIRSLPLRT